MKLFLPLPPCPLCLTSNHGFNQISSKDTSHLPFPEMFTSLNVHACRSQEKETKTDRFLLLNFMLSKRVSLCHSRRHSLWPHQDIYQKRGTEH